jgi:hypothetical protein
MIDRFIRVIHSSTENTGVLGGFASFVDVLSVMQAGDQIIDWEATTPSSSECFHRSRSHTPPGSLFIFFDAVPE